MELKLAPICKLSWENTQPEKMYSTGFEKAKGCGRIVNRTSDCEEAVVRRRSIKEVLWEISYN